MRDKHWFTIVGCVCGLALLTGCLMDQESAYRSVARKKLWPSAWGFPDREIVFRLLDEEGTTNDVLGFIRPDGSGLITRTVAPGLFTTLPTWGPDGDFIAFRAQWGGGYYYGLPWVVSAEGKNVGWCYKWGTGMGRLQGVSENQLIFSLSLEEEPDRIVLADFRSCEILKTLYEAARTQEEGLSEHLDSAMLSSQGLLALSRFLRVQGRRLTTADVVVVDLESGKEQVVGHGLAPAWSRDGEWLAFIGVDGIYIVRKDGSQKRQIVAIDEKEMSPRPGDTGLWERKFTVSWSPDGLWLVYHRLNPAGPASIYKVNVESGVETEIFQGGAYPDWRWDTASIEE